jgi:hypothetical protein
MDTMPEPGDDAIDEARLEQIVREGPVGTWAVAGLATFLVVLVYVLFYVFAYLPRGTVQ